MRNRPISRSHPQRGLWKSSRFPGWIALIALTLAMAASGCFSAVGHPFGPEPEPTPIPTPEPEPEPEPWPPEPEPCPIASEWATVDVTYPEWGGIAASVTINNSECSGSPLYLNNDCCYGVIARMERVHDDGTVEVFPPAWDCACGGPVDPMVIDPGDSLEIPDWGGYWFQESGNYRFVLQHSSFWECKTDFWTCVSEHPWQELETPLFWVEVGP